jgi:NAD(P)-dependent dehydrogenase (short-subunit alcohol dehydrogenase family)
MARVGRLDGHIALVTGATRGIGRAVALALAAEGARLVLCARTEEDLRAVAAELAGRADAHRCDVANPRDIEHAARAALERFGRVDIFVSNAGEALSMPILRTEVRFWNRMFTVHATAALLFGKFLIPSMQHHRFGRQIYVCSVAGLRGGKYIAAYAAAKHAQLGLARCMAAEFGEYGILTNAVCPGYVDTPATRRNAETAAARSGRSVADVLRIFAESNRSGRLIAPEEVARQVVELALPECTRNGEAVEVQ